MRRSFFLGFLIGAALALMPDGLIAQTATSGSIEGQVTDAQGLAVPGATITVTSGQGSKTAVTDGAGRYVAPFLTPGLYEVKAALSGFKTVAQPNVAVRVAQASTVNFKMDVGAVSEVVQVNAEALPVDAASTTTGATIESDTLLRLPVGRRVSDTFYLAPGVSSSNSGGAANPSISGGSALDNQYVIDGVNVTNTGYGGLGSYSIVFGSLGTATPFDFVKEVQVKTGGYDAEFGQATGGLVNVVTKSGSNDLGGSAFTYFRPAGLEGTRTIVSAVNGSVNTTDSHLDDGGFEIGGPMLRNRIFFFGAVDPSWEQQKLVAPPDFPLASLGPVAQDRRIVNYAGKLTGQITPNHRLDASFFGDPAEGANGPQRLQALLASDTSQFSRLNKYGGNNQTLNYSGALGRHWLLEGTVAHARNQVVETPSTDTWKVEDQTVTPTLNTGGIGFYEQGNDGHNTQYQAKSTNLFGAHELKYGVLFQDIGYSRLFNRTGPDFTLPDGQLSATGAQIIVVPDPVYGQIYRVSRANLINTEDTTQLYSAFFVEDTWHLHDFTIRPGLRYERQRLTGLLETLTLGSNWAPRIGVAYDPGGSDRVRLFANWGRFYAQVPNDLAARALSSDEAVSRADYFDAGLTQPVPEGVTALGVTNHYVLSGTSPDLIDPNVKSSYLDETVGGADFNVRGHLHLGVHYTHRTIPRVLEDVGPYAIGSCDLLGVGCNFNYTLTNPGPSTPVLDSLGATFEKPIHHYDAVAFLADR